MTVVDALVALALLAWVIRRQLLPRPVRDRRLRLVGVLTVVGVVQVALAVSDGPQPGPIGWALLAVGLVVGAVLGVWRSATMRLWFVEGRAWVQGGWPTLVLWVIGIGAHVGLDLLSRAVDPAAEPVNAASVLLFVGVSLGAQALATGRQVRAARVRGVVPA